MIRIYMGYSLKDRLQDNIGWEYVHKKTFEEGLMPNEDY
jgi:hypothetical protein